MTPSDLLVWSVFRVVAKPLFRIRILGEEHVPRRGPVLLVSNHLTFLDSLLIGACVQPVVRFLVWKPYYDRKLINWTLRIAKAIPITTEPFGAAASIRQARRELQRGQVVCVFAEGSISRTGLLLPFQRGLEEIVRGLDVPVVPVHLSGLWETVFSLKDGRFLWKRPNALRHRVAISFGAPMSPSSKANEVQRAVEQLGASALSLAMRAVDP